MSILKDSESAAKQEPPTKNDDSKTNDEAEKPKEGADEKPKDGDQIEDAAKQIEGLPEVEDGNDDELRDQEGDENDLQ